MSFIADQQTLDDLNILGKYKPNSLFSFFNEVKTTGGEKLLEEMFHAPLMDEDEINRRSKTFAHFQHCKIAFPFDAAEVMAMENYLDEEAGGNLVSLTFQIFRKQLLATLMKDEQLQTLVDGIMATIGILKAAKRLFASLSLAEEIPFYKGQMDEIKLVFENADLKNYLDEDPARISNSGIHLLKFDRLFRLKLRAAVLNILAFIYELDVYTTVAAIAERRSLSYAKALPKESNVFIAEELRHPAIEHAVGNPVSFRQDSNVIFLTGANMAGKSTFMKSYGIAIYLAHMGFPVGASSLLFSIKDGIYSSINVPDNLRLGYSHFYAEVLRVKNVAQDVSEGKQLVVIFDELFKGTNVKDAYDATYEVTAAFSSYRRCFFVISTHIIEVGNVLQQSHPHIQFTYLPTVMLGKVPKYTYKLTQGITEDRQGMTIIENEDIIKILNIF
ncbi:MutS domain III [Pedobacter sp. ok626]|uniref:MutS-related protein n=1 Tax=Pedobacter sp. ok626 TaxID=1761882 RepID=UPI000886BB86|nr:hypothetical protein [Pedobacter sp. ok626]SDL10331.1 MutS domain III [Pedobacter sp. ok626]